MSNQQFQHYVSKFYLDGFLDPKSIGQERIEPYLWYLDTEKMSIKRKPPQKIAGRRGFNDLIATLNGPKSDFEGHYSKLESMSAPVIRKIRRCKFDLSEDDKKTLILFLCHQKTRTPADRAFMWDLVEKEGNYFENRKKYEEMLKRAQMNAMHPENLEGFIEKVEHDSTVQFGFKRGNDYFKDIVDQVLEMKWTFIYPASRDSYFITSDNPVGWNGDDETIEEINLPISGICKLLIHRYDGFPEGPGFSDPEFIMGVNLVHLKRAHQQVFCPTEELAEWVKSQTEVRVEINQPSSK
jgi:hypothetical protein